MADQISMGDIATIMGDSPTDSDLSLTAYSREAGFTAPDPMSEFIGFSPYTLDGLLARFVQAGEFYILKDLGANGYNIYNLTLAEGYPLASACDETFTHILVVFNSTSNVQSLFSDDQGTTWQKIPGADDNQNACDMNQEGTLCAVSQASDGVMWRGKRLNGTWTWDYIDAGSFYYNIRGLAISGQKIFVASLEFDGLAYSGNAGDSWGSLQPCHAYGLGLQSVCASSDGKYIIAGDGNYGRVYVSSNSGVSWTEKNVGNSSSEYPRVSCDSSGQVVLAITAKGKTWASTNYGSTFINITANLGSPARNSFASGDNRMVSYDGTKFLIGDVDSYFVSINAGGSWVRRTIPVTTTQIRAWSLK